MQAVWPQSALVTSSTGCVVDSVAKIVVKTLLYGPQVQGGVSGTVTQPFCLAIDKLFSCWSFAKVEQTITAQKQNTIGSHNLSRTRDLIWVFDFSQTFRSSAYAKLGYITLKLDDVYIAFFTETRSIPNRK
jgi:hypothetical protein